jgi:hypothetical protein
MDHSRQHPCAAPLAVLIGSLALALPAHAVDTVFDFESGDVGSWLAATTGGSGSTGVEEHNGSLMAFVKHNGNGTHSLSHDFAYVAGDLVSFDMHAVAVLGSYTEYAASGVTLSFLTAFNTSLGTVGLYNTTDPAGLGAHQYAIDNVQHNYSDSMANWAALAGISGGTPIAKIGLSFNTYAQTYNVYQSYATVWFDNVRVAAVPEPGSWALMLAGLLATAHGVQRRSI